MNLPTFLAINDQPHIVSTSLRAVWLVPLLCLAFCSAAPAQVAQPVATPTDTTAPQPTASPVSTPTATPNFTDPSVIAAYNATRTPQVTITAAGSGSTVQPTVQDGVATLVHLPSPASAVGSRTASKVTTASTTNQNANPQPVVTMVLAYNPLYAGRVAWVQMLGTGTLSATDGEGHTYDGSNGLNLALAADGTATFSYQAPNVSGTYQVLTRFSNVTTTFPFLVPDGAP